MSPALTGFLSAAGGLVVLAIGAWLYRVVPPERRKTVATTMMAAGGLMLASVLLRAWGVLEEGPVTDAVMIGLLIAGFSVCITGFALYRRIVRAGR